MANSRSGESVLQRAVRVLDAFTSEHPVRTASEVARAAGLSTSTAHRLMAEMVEVGMLDRTEDARYVVGRRAWELSARVNPLERLRHAAQPVMEGIHSAVREYVSLSVPDFATGSVLYLERLDRMGDAFILAEQGGRLDMRTTSSGQAMLAFARQEEREAVLAMEGDDAGRSSQEGQRRLRHELAQIRSRGFVRIVGGMVAENTSFAVPVVGERGQLRGALSVVARTGAVDHHVVLSVLVAAGRTLSRELGAKDRAVGERPWLREGPPTVL